MKHYWYILLIILVPLSTFATPSVPYQFYGTVTQDGASVSDGLMVEIKIDGEVVAWGETLDSKFGLAPDLILVTHEDGQDGMIAHFFVNNIDTGEIYTFADDNLIEIILSLPAIDVPVVVTSSGGGGGGSYYYPTTQISELGKVDSNEDEEVDILDFVILMAHWGSEELDNEADFNEDGKVDILDFVVLMANWT